LLSNKNLLFLSKTLNSQGFENGKLIHFLKLFSRQNLPFLEIFFLIVSEHFLLMNKSHLPMKLTFPKLAKIHLGAYENIFSRLESFKTFLCHWRVKI